jgi:hypothetical protein
MTEVPLADGDIEGTVTVDLCAQCGSVYLEFFDGEPSNLVRAALGSGAMPEHPRQRAVEPPVCVDCEETMQLEPYMQAGPEVYRCGSCMSAFAVPSQVRALARYFFEGRAEGSFMDGIVKWLANEDER